MFLRKCRNELKTFSRCYCSNTNVENADTSLKSHPYCIPPFTNYVELTKLLLQNVIYKSEGLLILNRPHGLKKRESSERGFWQKKLKLTLSPSLQSVEKLSFTGVLPYLKKELKQDRIELLKVPDRHMSGVSVLSYENLVVPKRVSRALSPPDLPKYIFLAVCNGIPFTDSKSVKLGLTLLENGGSKKVTFVQNYSKRAIESGKVYPFIVNHKVLSANETLQVSLVELETTKNKWNGLRAYCAMRLLSPALGDNLFGSYVQEIKKTRIALDPFAPAVNKPYKVPPLVLDSLALTFKQQSFIPLHIHLAKLNFLKYKSDGRIFTARPPDHFFWTCERLELTIPEEYLENRVSQKFVQSTKLTNKKACGSNERGGDSLGMSCPNVDNDDDVIKLDDSMTDFRCKSASSADHSVLVDKGVS